MNLEELQSLGGQLLARVGACAGLAGLEAAEIEALGRKGRLKACYESLKDVPAADRPAFGKALNEIKTALETAVKSRRDELLSAAEQASELEESLDITLPGRRYRLGCLHPITQTIRDITRIFGTLGFSVAQGPDIELERFNFDALNVPAHHPARDMHDTFYVAPGVLLRTHTSNVQIRAMLERRPPLRVIAPGRCYRNDTIDATHSPIFHQIEGLYVDEGVSFADLKYTLTYFARALYGADVNVRFRPSFFPFTEPSAEYDFSCPFCRMKGCRVCKGTGWLEISGAGMVNPAVLSNVGVDSERYTGFAFGMGVERIAMLRYGIDDIRHLYENELDFLEQFRS